jgi:hypothetical protein
VTFLVPTMLFGWLALTVIFFRKMPSRRAVLCSVIGGVLFLPMASYDIPGFISYGKPTAIALGLILATVLHQGETRTRFRLMPQDVPMMVWCFVVPLATSLSNGLGLYDAISSMLTLSLSWGVVYWVGRVYFSELSSARQLCQAILIGGLLYVPLCLFEVRMSPQLSNYIYGFFPHSFAQHYRYGSFRPIVFMQHGLMVALWMAESSVVAFWMWRSREITRLKGIPMALLVLALVTTTVLCKSANGWVFLALGTLSWFYYRKLRSTWLLRIFIIIIPAYMLVRISGLVSTEQVIGAAQRVFDEERVASLSIRLLQENLFNAHALQRVLFGWGGWGRGWPVDPATGERAITMVDSFFVIMFSTYGLVGLISLFSALLIGPWTVLRAHKRVGKVRDIGGPDSNSLDLVLLSLVVIMFALDSLMNAMGNPVYVLCAGALVSYGKRIEEPARRVGETPEIHVVQSGVTVQ